MKQFPLAALAFVALTQSALAQHQTYVREQNREIKALSAKEIEEYRAGAGMGFARTAELNHYPGPMHVLELADKLGLSEEQLAATRGLMDAHKRDARAIGARLVEAETRLEGLFRARGVDETSLAKAVGEAAALQGEYRLSHLETHRRMRGLLTDSQVARYDELRGYSAAAGKKHKH